MAIGLLESELGATIIGTLGYGILLVLSARSANILLYCRDLSYGDAKMSRRMNTALLAVCFLMLLLCTVQWTLNVLSAYQAFVYEASNTGGALQYFTSPKGPHPEYTGQVVLTVFQCVIADLFVCFRLYIIWERNFWVCVFPVLSSLVLIVANIILCLELSVVPIIGLPISSTPGTYLVYATTLATNLYSTIMIAYRIWRENTIVRELSGGPSLGPNASTRALRIFVESAALYTTVSLASLVAFAATSAIVNTFIAMISPTIGIAFCMIIVRVGKGTNRQSQLHPQDSEFQLRRSTPLREMATV